MYKFCKSRFKCTKVLFLMLLVCCVISIGEYYLINRPSFSTADIKRPGEKPPDLSSFNNRINSEHICNNSTTSIRALLVVISHTGSVKARQSIRNAYPVGELNNIKMKRIFLLGTLINDREANKYYKSIPQSQIVEENQIYKDIVQYDVREHYYNLTYKSLLGVQWASKYCSEAKFIIKLDDDAIVDLYQLTDILRKNNDNRTTILGSQTENMGRVFLEGFLYVMSPTTARILLETSKSVPYFQHEDVYMTNLLAKTAGVSIENIGYIYTRSSCLQCCSEETTNIKYQCRFVIGQRLGHGEGGDYGLLEHVQKHAAYCYYNQDCNRFPRWKYFIGKYLIAGYIKCIPDHCLSVV